MARKEQVAFLLEKSQKEIIDELTDEEAGIIFKAIFEYEETKKVPKLERTLKLVFKQIKIKLDAYDEAYEEKRLKNKENVMKRWNKESDTTVYDCIRTNTNYTNKDKINKNKIKKNKINNNNNSVCVNKNARAREDNFICHLGSNEKSESCFYCMKKNNCPFPESANFKAKYNMTFNEWNEQKKQQAVSFVESNDDNKNIYDFDWLNENE